VLGFAAFVPPIDLAIVGAPGCWQHATLDVTTVVLGSSTGVAAWAVALPNAPSLAGVDVFMQGVVVDPGVNASGLTTSNGLRLTLAQ
jgi:hypothetical protein